MKARGKVIPLKEAIKLEEEPLYDGEPTVILHANRVLVVQNFRDQDLLLPARGFFPKEELHRDLGSYAVGGIQVSLILCQRRGWLTRHKVRNYSWADPEDDNVVREDTMTKIREVLASARVAGHRI